MDDESYSLLKAMNLEHMFPVKLNDIMTEELIEVQKRTTKGQFCWVCQPIICQYILDKFKADIVTYLEADSLFFADPEILLNELGNYSVSLVPHNYAPGFDNKETAGEFCVQFNAFRNDELSAKVLNYWKENCFKYSKQNLTLYPGQTCLDNWTTLFEGVKSLSNPGAGVAPWNVSQYSVLIKNNQLCVDDSPIVFYHFHQYGRYQDGDHELGNYPFSKDVIKLIYGKYIAELQITENMVHQIDPKFNFRRLYQKETSGSDIKTLFNSYLTILKRRIKKRYNVFSPKYFDV